MAARRPAQDTVCLAVGLGWLLAELYDSRRLPGPPPDDDDRPLPPHLPGIGAMTPYEKACALAAHVGADLARLEAALGLGMPTAKSIQAVLDTPGHARDDVRRAVHDLYSRALTNPDQRPPSSPTRAWPRGHERRLACRG
jgi:hypothetical protein